MVESDLRPLTQRPSLASRSPLPRVSILLPFRDAAPTLPACLASIARQTEPDWECIALDDGSVDGGGSFMNSCCILLRSFRTAETDFVMRPCSLMLTPLISRRRSRTKARC